jgi:hypothetical protein
LYREIRIDNTLTNENGEEVSLKPGAQAEVTVEADAEATTPKNSRSPYRIIAAVTGVGATILSTVEVNESFTEFPRACSTAHRQSLRA